MTKDDPGEKYKFDLRVTKHDAKEIKIKLNFENPEFISRSIEPDLMEISVMQPQVFISKDLTPLEVKDFGSPDQPFL